MKHIATLRNPEIIAAALGVAQAIGFAWASVVAEGNGSPITLLMALMRGLFLGFALSFGLIMISHAVPRIDPRHKRIFWTGWASFVGLLLISPAIIAPAIQYSIPAYVLAHPASRWAWAIAIAAAPDLVAIGIAVNGKLLQVAQPEATTTQPEQPKNNQNKPVVKELSDVALMEELKRNPNATQAQLGTTFQVSAAAIGKRLRRMKGRGE